MSEVTIEAIGELLEKKFDEKFEPINTKLEAMQETLASHTASLDAIANDVKDINDTIKIQDYKFEKYEKAIKFVAKNVGVNDEVAKIIRG